MELDRRRFIWGAALAAAATASAGAAVGCAPKPTIASARHTLRGLWDAAVPGTWNGVVEDWSSPGVPAPGADDARVQDWLELVMGSLAAPLEFVGEGFFRAWAADLDLWADTFHPPFDGLPTFGHLPLGPSLAERGRQYKVMLMQNLFDGPLDLKYFAGITLAKVGFYADAHHELTGEGEPVGGRYIGFPGPNADAPPTEFSFRAPYGFADERMITVAGGLVAAP
jgi:hypothetical protein